MRLAGVFSEDGRTNALYRAILPLQEMERRGHAVVWPRQGSADALLSSTVPKWDLVHVFQSLAPEHLEVIVRLRENGVAVVWDSDDDISTVPRTSPAYRRMGGRRAIKAHTERSFAIARAAHLMTTPSVHLAARYAAAGAKTVVIENALAPTAVVQRRRPHAGIVIGCTAGFEHGPDLKRHRIAQVLSSILETYEGVRVVTIGLGLDLRGPRYLHRPRVHAAELIAYESEFDIGIAPLVDTPLNRARSNVKLKEYAAAGATWLASPVGPYVGLGEAEGGQLVADGQWFEALAGLIEDRGRRRALAARAGAWVERQTIRHAGAAWEKAFRDAIVRARRA